MKENHVSEMIVDAAFRIHKRFEPGLFESVYHQVLEYELIQRGLAVASKRRISVVYDELVISDAFEPDLVVQELVIVEIKSVEEIAPIHKAQLLTYLRLTGLKLGLLINFNSPYIKKGIYRFVNGLD